MDERDMPHMVFYADNDIYHHYTWMSFRLINAGTTNQSMVNKLFVDMISNTIEDYVDDMVVKSKVGIFH